jgi:hypothetical protein
MKTHTPGPWLATPTTGNPHNPDSLRMDIVTTSGEWNPAFIAGDILPEDARLIASAPEMLEIIRALLPHASNEWERLDDLVHRGSRESENAATELDSLIDRAREIVAKIGGSN